MKSLLFVAAALTSAMSYGATLSADTLRNLNTAFLGESNAHVRYVAFAQQAEKENLPEVAKLFRAAARAEAIHRDNHKEVILRSGGVPDPTPLEQPKVGTTAENLKAAIAGESYERDTMYPQFLATAKAENGREAIRTLRFAAEAESQHAKLYQQALEQLGRNQPADLYVCPTCGATVSERPGTKCPTCREPADKFEQIS